ncbi:MAG TPA: hypothetical protein VES42_04135 [Pilimelia sp.]|nr:hypothetical protein [Pilimelia sp.]
MRLQTIRVVAGVLGAGVALLAAAPAAAAPEPAEVTATPSAVPTSSPTALAPPLPPTAVTLGWADGVRVAWQEAAPSANRVVVVRPDGSATDLSRDVPADQPNAVVLPPGSFPQNELLRVQVTAVAADGTASAPATSPQFDTDRPGLRVTAAEPRFDGSLRVRWELVQRERVPGDPLDRPATPVRFSVYATEMQPNSWQLVTGPTDAVEYVVPARALPYDVAVVTTATEWGQAGVYPGRLHRTALSTRVPVRATAGRPVTVTGRSQLAFRGCDLAACWAVPTTLAGQPVTLQSRANASATWRTVARGVTDKDGDFRLTVPAGAAGSRQYRVVAPNVPVAPIPNGDGIFGATSPAVRTVVTAAAGGGGSGGGGGGGGGRGTGADGLPITGTDTSALLATGIVLVLAGVLFRLASRVRRPR